MLLRETLQAVLATPGAGEVADHDHTHNPLPIRVVQPDDSALSLREITGVLAESRRRPIPRQG